jgi:hypothetical protein
MVGVELVEPTFKALTEIPTSDPRNDCRMKRLPHLVEAKYDRLQIQLRLREAVPYRIGYRINKRMIVVDRNQASSLQDKIVRLPIFGQAQESEADQAADMSSVELREALVSLNGILFVECLQVLPLAARETAPSLRYRSLRCWR